MGFEYLQHANNSTNIVYEFSNKNNKIYIYKDESVFEAINNDVPQIGFGDCYYKVKKHYNISEDLLKVIINSEEDKSLYGKYINKYALLDPKSGKMLNTTNVCDDNDKMTMTKEVDSMFEGYDEEKKEDMYFLLKQGIDIFNKSDRFYTDICYYFESPNKKDIPLKDRLSAYYPNITLCDPGCEYKGVDFETMEVKCECIFNDLMNNKIFENNIYGGTISEIINVLNIINIKVFKCFKDIFYLKHLKKCLGGLFILILLSSQIICIIKFVKNEFISIKHYALHFMDFYFLHNINNKRKGNEPPKKKSKEPIK